MPAAANLFVRYCGALEIFATITECVTTTQEADLATASAFALSSSRRAACGCNRFAVETTAATRHVAAAAGDEY